MKKENCKELIFLIEAALEDALINPSPKNCGGDVFPMLVNAIWELLREKNQKTGKFDVTEESISKILWEAREILEKSVGNKKPVEENGK